MSKLIDKLWNWGHLEGSHNEYTKMNCNMTPEGFAEEYGIKNSFIISYGGNIQPPFDEFAKRFSVLNEVKWSVLGDASTPLPEAELGNTQDVIDALEVSGNITGGIVDDFFSPERMERFTPEVLMKITYIVCVLFFHRQYSVCVFSFDRQINSLTIDEPRDSRVVHRIFTDLGKNYFKSVTFCCGEKHFLPYTP